MLDIVCYINHKTNISKLNKILHIFFLREKEMTCGRREFSVEEQTITCRHLGIKTNN